MSEQVLKAILRLFAVLARQEEVTQQEREQVRQFLRSHLNEARIETYLTVFDQSTTRASDTAEEINQINKICEEVSRQLTQKQKVVIFLELARIVIADKEVSDRELQLLNATSKAFGLPEKEASLIRRFVTAKSIHELDFGEVLMVSNGTQTLAVARLIVRKNLDGFLSILFIQKFGLYFFRFEGHDDVYLNSVPIKAGTVGVVAVGSMFRWDKDEPLYYGDIQKVFKVQGNEPRLTFEAKNIIYEFPNGGIGLRDVTLAEESGKLIALMGASGAGKSTLLHVLNGLEKPTQGQVLINGIDIHKSPKQVEGLIGFVPQDDLLIEDLTVYQNLYYAAKLCFNNKTQQEIDALVIKTLEDLGLHEIKHLKVGSPLRKTISGGQRKRLNIGLELLREPAVLFCDEPTSGLSSRDSENIIDLLKELSLKGKLVFAVIHQPSSDIFKMFDKLLILDSGGYQIYYGNPVNAVVYFKRSIDMINSDVGECHACGNVNPEQIFNIIETKVINEYGAFTNERKITAKEWNGLFVKNTRLPEVKTSGDKLESSLRIPPRIKQAHLFSMRDIQSKIHNRQYMIINLLEAPLLAFILAFIVRYYNIDDESITGYVFGKNLNLPAYLFMSVIVALFMGLTVSAEEIIRDRKILKREAFLHLSRSSYIVSKVSILFMLSALQTFMFVMVGNYILGIHGMLLEHWFILFTTSCFANMLGLNISSGFNSAVTIYILIPLLLIPQLILSGVVVKFDKLNPAIGNSSTVPLVGDLMASRWAFEASMVSQFKDNPYEEQFYLYDKVMAQSDFQKVYFIPELETRLQYCQGVYDKNPNDPKFLSNLELIRNEMETEFKVSGEQRPPWMDHFTPQKFDSVTFNRAYEFLETLRKFYSNRFVKADQAREKVIETLTSTPEKTKEFEAYKERYHNEAITALVKNMDETHRIIEKNGKLVQKIYPVYKDPDPDHTVDFNAQFYMASKHFLNRNVDTFYFNTGVIWSMTLVLAILLYFDALRRVIDGISTLSTPAVLRRK
ncbi:MAG: ATP-binding cassette domain-containing protein [Flammeovirgaceae bacterium]|nr:ATP-binding cassette domain-containing protein [Flammeovirgaceae bacterium]